MSHAKLANRLGRSQLLAAVLILVGLAMIAASFLLPVESSRRGAWSDEQARRYQAVSIRLHSLSHQVTHAAEDKHSNLEKQRQEAKAEFDTLRSELESAVARPKRMSWLLRLVGVLLILGGVAANHFWPPPEKGDDF
jgi:hypothetical protein